MPIVGETRPGRFGGRFRGPRVQEGSRQVKTDARRVGRRDEDRPARAWERCVNRASFGKVKRLACVWHVYGMRLASVWLQVRPAAREPFNANRGRAEGWGGAEPAVLGSGAGTHAPWRHALRGEMRTEWWVRTYPTSSLGRTRRCPSRPLPRGLHRQPPRPRHQSLRPTPPACR